MNGFNTLMPRKKAPSPYWHPKLVSRLSLWGRCIRAQRVRQKIKATMFCERVGVSVSTLRRIELGDPTVAAGSYLTALNALGLFDPIVPEPDVQWYADTPHTARATRTAEEDQNDYF